MLFIFVTRYTLKFFKLQETLEFTNSILLPSRLSKLHQSLSPCKAAYAHTYMGSDPEADGILDTSQVKENTAFTLETYSLKVRQTTSRQKTPR